MLDPDQLLSGLNDAQREAVTTVEGPVLVLAGPGSGKTRVLTHRVAYIVGVVGVPAWHLMAVTFTNKAAKEMKERLGGLIGPTALDQLTIGTFHAICARLLRREAQTLAFDDRFVIFDTDDQLRAIKQAMADLNLDEKTYRPQSVLGSISSAKNELIRAEDYVAPSYWHEVAGRVYKRYQAILRANNALDFDDLLLETALLLRDNETIAARYKERYGFLMVDEFQDTNTAQYAMLRSLSAAADKDAPHNLCAVGDEDQSIYRWRGEVLEGSEFRVLFKTQPARYAQIEAAIRQHHPYELPAIHALATSAADPVYAAWVAESSTGQGDRAPIGDLL
jgi:DNA helicase-2/ATP-dependent DNA helicase PcrA